MKISDNIDMKTSIFKKQPLAKPSFLQKILNQTVSENAIIELNNLLASKTVLNISPNEVDELESRYGVDLIREFKLNLEEFYAVYLNYCLSDKYLSETELFELSHLKMILNLDDRSVEKIHQMVGKLVYEKSFKEMISDGRLTDEEKMFLEKLEVSLKLPNKLVQKISSEIKSEFIQNFISQAMEDQRLSPSEEEELQKIASSLNIKLNFPEKTKQKMERLKIYWALENLELPVINSGVILQKYEQCHLAISNVYWYELRSIARKTNYAGLSASVKIAKGLYLRTGSYSSRTVSTPELQLLDKGNFYLTNKRIIFIGQRGNHNIKLTNIIGFTPFSDGIEIGKNAGKGSTYKLPNGIDILCIMLERLLRS